MILDKQNLFSDRQAVTATSYSTNAIDLGSAHAGEGGGTNLLAQVVKTFAGGTDIALALETADNAAFTGGVTAQSVPAVLTATLKAGYRFNLGKLPDGLKRYVRLKYTVTGTMTVGEITAGLILDKETNG